MNEIVAYRADTGEAVFEHEVEEMFDEMLNECHEAVLIGYGTYYPADILRELSPTDYRIGLSEYLSNLIEDGELTEDEPEDEDEDEED